MIEEDKDQYHSRASPSNEKSNIFMSKSSWYISSWNMHWWNMMRWSEGLSSFFSTNLGTWSPQISIEGTRCGKPGTVEKSRHENLRAKRAANAFDIWLLWIRHWIYPSWSHHIDNYNQMMSKICLSSKFDLVVSQGSWASISSPRQRCHFVITPRKSLGL